MITSQPTEAWILLCTILMILGAVSSNDGPQASSVSPAQESRSSYDTQTYIYDEKKDQNLSKIACISSDPNIYKIIEKTRNNCKGNDYSVTFYYQEDNGYTELGSFEVDKYLFHDVLMKYSNWILAGENSNLEDNRKATIAIKNNNFKATTSSLQYNDGKQSWKSEWQTMDDYNINGLQNTEYNSDISQDTVKQHTFFEMPIYCNKDISLRKANIPEYLKPRYNPKLKGYEVFLPNEKGQQLQPQIINFNHDSEVNNISNLEPEKAATNEIFSEPALVENLNNNVIEFDSLKDVGGTEADLKREVINLLLNDHNNKVYYEPKAPLTCKLGEDNKIIDSDMIHTSSMVDADRYYNDANSYLQDVEQLGSKLSICNNLDTDNEFYKYNFFPSSTIDSYVDSDSDTMAGRNIDNKINHNFDLLNRLNVQIFPKILTLTTPCIKTQINDYSTTLTEVPEQVMSLLPLNSKPSINVKPDLTGNLISIIEPEKYTSKLSLPQELTLPIDSNIPSLPGITSQPCNLYPFNSISMPTSLLTPQIGSYLPQTAGFPKSSVNMPLPVNEYGLTSSDNINNYADPNLETSLKSSPVMPCKIQISTFINPNIDLNDFSLSQVSAEPKTQTFDPLQYSSLLTANNLPILKTSLQNQDASIWSKIFLPQYITTRKSTPQTSFGNLLTSSLNILSSIAPDSIKPLTSSAEKSKIVPMQKSRNTNLQGISTPSQSPTYKYSPTAFQTLSNGWPAVNPTVPKESIMEYPLPVNAEMSPNFDTYYSMPEASPLIINLPSFNGIPTSIQSRIINKNLGTSETIIRPESLNMQPEISPLSVITSSKHCFQPNDSDDFHHYLSTSINRSQRGYDKYTQSYIPLVLSTILSPSSTTTLYKEALSSPFIYTSSNLLNSSKILTDNRQSYSSISMNPENLSTSHFLPMISPTEYSLRSVPVTSSSLTPFSFATPVATALSYPFTENEISSSIPFSNMNSKTYANNILKSPLTQPVSNEISILSSLSSNVPPIASPISTRTRTSPDTHQSMPISRDLPVSFSFINQVDSSPSTIPYSMSAYEPEVLYSTETEQSQTFTVTPLSYSEPITSTAPYSNSYEKAVADLSESPKIIDIKTNKADIHADIHSKTSDTLTSFQPYTKSLQYKPIIPLTNWLQPPICSYSWLDTNFSKPKSPLKPKSKLKPVTIWPISETTIPTHTSNYPYRPNISPAIPKLSTIKSDTTPSYISTYFTKGPVQLQPNSNILSANLVKSVIPYASLLSSQLKLPSRYSAESLNTYSNPSISKKHHSSSLQNKILTSSTPISPSTFSIPMLETPFVELTSPVSFLDPLSPFSNLLLNKGVPEPIFKTHEHPNIKEFPQTISLPISSVSSTVSSIPETVATAPFESLKVPKPTSSLNPLNLKALKGTSNILSSPTTAYTSSIGTVPLNMSSASSKEILQPTLTTPIPTTLGPQYYLSTLDKYIPEQKPLPNLLLSPLNAYMPPQRKNTSQNTLSQFQAPEYAIDQLLRVKPSLLSSSLPSLMSKRFFSSQLPTVTQDVQLKTLPEISANIISLSPQKVTPIETSFTTTPTVSSTDEFLEGRPIKTVPLKYSNPVSAQMTSKRPLYSSFQSLYMPAKPMKFLGMLHDTATIHNISYAPISFTSIKPQSFTQTDNSVLNYSHAPQTFSLQGKLIPKAGNLPNSPNPFQYTSKMSYLQPPLLSGLLNSSSYMPSPGSPNSLDMTSVLQIFPLNIKIPTTSNTSIRYPWAKYINPFVSTVEKITNPISTTLVPLISQTPAIVEKAIPELTYKISEIVNSISTPFISSPKSGFTSSYLSAMPNQYTLDVPLITKPYEWFSFADKTNLSAFSQIPSDTTPILGNTLPQRSQLYSEALLPQYELPYHILSQNTRTSTTSTTTHITPIQLSPFKLLQSTPGLYSPINISQYIAPKLMQASYPLSSSILTYSSVPYSESISRPVMSTTKTPESKTDKFTPLSYVPLTPNTITSFPVKPITSPLPPSKSSVNIPLNLGTLTDLSTSFSTPSSSSTFTALPKSDEGNHITYIPKTEAYITKKIPVPFIKTPNLMSMSPSENIVQQFTNSLNRATFKSTLYPQLSPIPSLFASPTYKHTTTTPITKLENVYTKFENPRSSTSYYDSVISTCPLEPIIESVISESSLSPNLYLPDTYGNYDNNVFVANSKTAQLSFAGYNAPKLSSYSSPTTCDYTKMFTSLSQTEPASTSYTPSTTDYLARNHPFFSSTISYVPKTLINDKYGTSMKSYPSKTVSKPSKIFNAWYKNIIPQYTPLSYKLGDSPIETSTVSILPSNLGITFTKPLYTAQNLAPSDSIMPPFTQPQWLTSNFNKDISPLSNLDQKLSIVDSTSPSFLNPFTSPERCNIFESSSLFVPTVKPLSTPPNLSKQIFNLSPKSTFVTTANLQHNPQYALLSANKYTIPSLNVPGSSATPIDSIATSSSVTSDFTTSQYRTTIPKTSLGTSSSFLSETNADLNTESIASTFNPTTPILSTLPIVNSSPASTLSYSPPTDNELITLSNRSNKYSNVPQNIFKTLSPTYVTPHTYSLSSNIILPKPASCTLQPLKFISSLSSTKPVELTQYYSPGNSNSPELTSQISSPVYRHVPNLSTELIYEPTSYIPLQYSSTNLPLTRMFVPLKSEVATENLESSTTLYSYKNDVAQPTVKATQTLSDSITLSAALSQRQTPIISTPEKSVQPTTFALSYNPLEESTTHHPLVQLLPNRLEYSSLITPLTSVTKTAPTNISPVTNKPIYSTQNPTSTTISSQYSSLTQSPLNVLVNEYITSIEPTISSTSSAYIPKSTKFYTSPLNSELHPEPIPISLAAQAAAFKYIDTLPALSTPDTMILESLSTTQNIPPKKLPSQTKSLFSPFSYTEYSPPTFQLDGLPTSSYFTQSPIRTYSSTQNIPKISESLSQLTTPMYSTQSMKLTSDFTNAFTPFIPQHIINYSDKLFGKSTSIPIPITYNEYLKPCNDSNLSTTATIPSLNANYMPVTQNKTPQNLEDQFKSNVINYITNDRQIKSIINNAHTDLSIPLGNFIITKKQCYNPTIQPINSSIGLKMWPSNIKLVEAKLELKFKDLQGTNFEPIVRDRNYNLKEIENVVADYIRNKYGDVIIVNDTYSLNNEYEVIKSCDFNVNSKYNLLWPANTCII